MIKELEKRAGVLVEKGHSWCLLLDYRSFRRLFM